MHCLAGVSLVDSSSDCCERASSRLPPTADAMLTLNGNSALSSPPTLLDFADSDSRQSNADFHAMEPIHAFDVFAAADSALLPLSDFALDEAFGGFQDQQCAAPNWTLRAPEQWQPHDVSDWIRTWAAHNGVQDLEVAHLLYNHMPGFELCQLRREYFTSVCPQFGDLIFEALQLLRQQHARQQHFQPPEFAFPSFDLLCPQNNVCLDLDAHH
ncbi:unnamed protein product, partial [Oppiella nova]